MKITGEANVAAPVERVWWALNDPSVLVRTIPGCLQLEETGPDAYRMTVTAGVAAIKGTYDGEVRITDQQEPDRFVLHASGAGAPGTVSADVVVTLVAHGDGTRLAYDADAVVGGVLGGVGQRMIASVARKTASEFFANVEDVLHGRGPVGGCRCTPGNGDRRGCCGVASAGCRQIGATAGRRPASRWVRRRRSSACCSAGCSAAGSADRRARLHGAAVQVAPVPGPLGAASVERQPRASASSTSSAASTQRVRS